MVSLLSKFSSHTQTEWEVKFFLELLVWASVVSLLGTLYCLDVCQRHTGSLFHSQNSLSPFLTFFFFFTESTSAPLALWRSDRKHMAACTLTYSSKVWLWFHYFLIIPLLVWSLGTLHNWQTCKSVTCKNSWVRRLIESVWTLHCQHIPGVGQWEVHSVLCRIALHILLVCNQDAFLPETRPEQHRCPEV